MRKLLITSCLLFVAACNLQAQIKLPAILRDSMILQRDKPARLWGWASAHEKIAVYFNKKKYKSKANAEGQWEIFLPPTKAGGPYSIELVGKNKIQLKDILFGEVWFCSGQSNMVHQLDIHDVTYAKEIAEANDADIRQFWIPTLPNLHAPQNDIAQGYWKPAVGKDVRPFSAVAYFFAKKIKARYNVPVGIINASVGGSPINAWISESGLKDLSEYSTTIHENKNPELVAKKSVTTPAPTFIDQGIEEQWFSTTYIPKGWRSIYIPGYWKDQGIKDFTGIVWYRKNIQVSENMANQPARLHMGRIVDADEVYINGKRIGSTGYQYPQRRYTIPAGVLHAGSNLVVIKVTGYGQQAGFVPDKSYVLVAGKDTVDMHGAWKYKVGTVFPKTTHTSGFNKQNQPTALFNGMVAPFTRYSIKGICWYQGESDAGQPEKYLKLTQQLISDWRTQFQNDTLPFYYVQLPGFMEFQYRPSESNWAKLREAQLQALTIPHTGMAVVIDCGEWNDIHPENKKDVGERLALQALRKTYGENIVCDGPLFDTAIIINNTIEIQFHLQGSALRTFDGEPLAEFAIAGADKKFVWAKTKIENNKVVAWHPDLPQPLYVRYAWADNPVNANLVNTEGLFASPFRTDK